MSEVAVDTTAAEQSSFEAALAAALATQGTEQVPVEAPVKTESAPAQTTQAPVEPAPPPPSPKELERIAALEAREARVREAEAKLKAAEAPTPAPVKPAPEPFDIQRFMADPVGYVLKHKPDLTPAEAAKVAEPIYYHALGDKAPPEHRQRQEVAKVTTEVRTEVDQLRAELQELREARAREAQQAQLGQYRAELRTGADAVPDAPLVKSLVARNPGRAEELLFEVARRAAIESRERGESEPVVLTPAQAAAQLEAILKAQRDELFGPPPVETQATNAKQSAPAPTTITNRDASVQSPRTAPDSLDDKVLRKAALEAAGLGSIPVWD